MFKLTGYWILDESSCRLLIAYLITLPIGYLREKEAHSVGVRTFPIVAMASCGYLLISNTGTEAFTRVLQGLIAGIGFVGGGAILKEGNTIHGAATAASILNTGVIGAAVAMGKFDVAIVLAAVNGLTLHLMRPWKQRLDFPDGPSK